MAFETDKKIIIDPTRHLYKWAKGFHHLQKNFFVDDIKLRREKQIEDFIMLNGFTQIKFKIDTDIFKDLNVGHVDVSTKAELVVITDQKFSRYPCPVIVNKIREQLKKCPRLYLCLNRHYINVDNSYHDTSLDTNLNRAITQWLVSSLPEFEITDLSLDYLDIGEQFTWVIPDRHYYIRVRHG
jgi:hypothetical protein